MTGRTPYLLHHLVEEAAASNPDHPAFVLGDTALSYGDLWLRASSLATALTSAGVAVGDRVAILSGKSLDSAVAVYGIMMAGAAYVPIDPASPASRAGFILRDCGVNVMISEPKRERLVGQLAEEGAQLDLVIDGGDHPFDAMTWTDVGEDEGLSLPEATETDLCYILYTSGSTGVPKGIAHTHRSALAWANVSADAYSISPSDVLSNYGPLHFDQSTLDLFTGAHAGATTTMIPEDRMRLPASLVELIESARLTVFYTVPTTLGQIASPELLEGRDLTDLRLILFGGEPMPLKHLATLMQWLPDTRFFNIYGPSEVNGVTHHEVRVAPEPGDPPVPIGRPYDNVETFVVGEDAEIIEDGQVGELFVRAPTMMDGYWARPELTSAATYERPQSGQAPDVFHKTGDLVHRSPDGLFHFHGRKDRQVKVRGFRVELDEVEAALLSNPDVLEAAVFVAADEMFGDVIRAAVIVAADASPDEGSIAAHIRQVLPVYALPASLIVRTEFPRTQSGKIDRRALEAELDLAAP